MTDHQTIKTGAKVLRLAADHSGTPNLAETLRRRFSDSALEDCRTLIAALLEASAALSPAATAETQPVADCLRMAGDAIHAALCWPRLIH